MTVEANTAQIAYWNGPAAEKWVRHREAMDAHMTAATDLLIAKGRPGPDEAVLDVGCGTGASLLRLVAAVGDGGRVLGIDISEPMLSVARQRTAGLANVALLRADAQTHRFEPAAFDLVLSRFGVMFFADPIAAFANLRGALRPGGRLAFVCWAALEANPWFLLPLEAAARHLGPPEPARPGEPGPLAFADPDHVRRILDAAGFTDVRIETEAPLFSGFGSTAEQAAFACEVGPAARLIAERGASAATRAAIEADIAAAFASYVRDGRIRVPTRLHYVLARRNDAT